MGVLLPLIVSGCRSTPEPLIQHYASQFNNVDLKYYLLLPASAGANRKIPLLILFHGVGEDALDYMELFEDFSRDQQTALLSLEINIDKRVNEADFLSHAEVLIKQVVRQNNIDGAHVMLCGVSAGGILAQNLMLMNPNHYSRLLIISAPLVESALWDKARDVFFPKLFIVYGENDEQVDRMEMEKDLELLRTYGVIGAEYRVPSAGHEEWREWLEPIWVWLSEE